MVSPIEICNSAIVRLGGNPITSLQEDSVEARACNQQYDIVRRDLLRSHPWNFAIKRTMLAEDVNSPPFTYSHAYVLPSDLLRLLRTKRQEDEFLFNFGGDFNGFVTISNQVNFSYLDRYKIEGRRLLTNFRNEGIVYIADVEDTTQMDPSFVEVLSVRLAFVIAYRITGSVQIRGDLLREFELLLRAAKEDNGQEGTIERIETSSWLASRGW